MPALRVPIGSTVPLEDVDLIYRTLVLVLVALTGCTTTPNRILEGGAVPLTRDELVALVDDRTEPWPQGANYYYPGGKLFVRWNNAIYKGAWEARDGSLCRYVPELLPEPCADYFQDSKGIIRLYEGKRVRLSTEDFLEGDQLQGFWRNQL